MKEKQGPASNPDESSSSVSGTTQSNSGEFGEYAGSSVPKKSLEEQYEFNKSLMRMVLWITGIVLVINFLVTLLVSSPALELATNPANLTDVSASPDGKIIIAIGTIKDSVQGENVVNVGGISSNVILRNSNYGTGSWNAVSYVATEPLKKLEMDWSSGRGICIGGRGTYLTTSDSGLTWDLKAITLRGDTLGQLEDIDMNWKTGQGLCIGEKGVILSTSDSGVTWSYVNEIFVNHPKVEIIDGL